MNWKAPRWMVPFGATCAAVSVIAGLFHNDGLLWPGLWIFVATLIAANIDRIDKLKAGTSGIEFEARRVVEEAKSTVVEMQMLAKHLATISLSLVKRSARIGGFPPAEEEEIRERTLQLLRSAHVPETEIPDVLAEWHRWVFNDYVLGILGNGMTPDGLGQPEVSVWKEMRRRAYSDDRPTAAEIRDWLNRHGYASQERLELLEDYQFYLENKRHRRPEVWASHHEWPRLTPARDQATNEI
ncbi:hypothetical protein [Paraburkholderia sp. RL17-381-BIF-C]|uniref:hypothetical protein n=1 Tax=Paraburkholderia sp. RL17-381-BIF-C TaxID=3031635 RepID=UPI0038B93EB7